MILGAMTASSNVKPSLLVAPLSLCLCPVYDLVFVVHGSV